MSWIDYIKHSPDFFYLKIYFLFKVLSENTQEWNWSDICIYKWRWSEVFIELFFKDCLPYLFHDSEINILTKFR